MKVRKLGFWVSQSVNCKILEIGRPVPEGDRTKFKREGCTVMSIVWVREGLVVEVKGKVRVWHAISKTIFTFSAWFGSFKQVKVVRKDIIIPPLDPILTVTKCADSASA